MTLVALSRLFCSLFCLFYLFLLIRHWKIRNKTKKNPPHQVAFGSQSCVFITRCLSLVTSAVRKLFLYPVCSRSRYLFPSWALGLIVFVLNSLALKLRAQQCRIPPTCSVCTAAWPLTSGGAPVTRTGFDLRHKELSSLSLPFMWSVSLLRSFVGWVIYSSFYTNIGLWLQS